MTDYVQYRHAHAGAPGKLCGSTNPVQPRGFTDAAWPVVDMHKSNDP